MLNIYLTRHGQDIDNLRGVLNGRRNKPLTELGENQARELALKIKSAKINFDRIYSSPLKRAFKTAQIISELLGKLELEIFEDLIERDFGIMSGKHHTKIDKICAPHVLKTGLVTYFLQPEGAETFPDLVKRGKRVLKKIEDKHRGGNVLLVTHGDIGKMIYVAYYNLHWREVLKMFHFGNSDLLLMSKNSPADKAHIFKTKQHNL